MIEITKEQLSSAPSISDAINLLKLMKERHGNIKLFVHEDVSGVTIEGLPSPELKTVKIDKTFLINKTAKVLVF